MTERHVGITRDWSVPLLTQKWRCSKQHIYSLIASGELRAFHVGRRIVVPADEVERFEREHVIAPSVLAGEDATGVSA